jgi:hypothetical protein
MRTINREQRCWAKMIQRCVNPRSNSYHNYGGRGIRVCARWLKSFDNFLADMGPKPSPKHSIERRDNDGDYTPSNCCWATRHEQHRNMRRNMWITLDGVTLCLKDWARRTGMDQMTIKGRLRRGWSVKDALTIVADKSASCGRYHRAKSLAMTECRWGHAYPRYMYLKPITGTNKVAKCCRECDRLRQQRVREQRRKDTR